MHIDIVIKIDKSNTMWWQKRFQNCKGQRKTPWRKTEKNPKIQRGLIGLRLDPERGWRGDVGRGFELFLERGGCLAKAIKITWSPVRTKILRQWRLTATTAFAVTRGDKKNAKITLSSRYDIKYREKLYRVNLPCV